MRIAVCDDNKQCLKELQQLLEQFSFVRNVDCFSDIDHFFSCLSSEEYYDLILMDLDWKEDSDGIHHAERLYHMAPHLPILYVTGYNDVFAQHIFLRDSNLLGYLTKPVDPLLLEKYLQKALTRRKRKEMLSFPYQGGLISLNIRNVLYLESHDHITMIHTETVSYPIRKKLGELFLSFPNQLVQCHKSYAVNLYWIQRMIPGYLILRNGTEIPISRSYAGQTRETVFDFMNAQV